MATTTLKTIRLTTATLDTITDALCVYYMATQCELTHNESEIKKTCDAIDAALATLDVQRNAVVFDEIDYATFTTIDLVEKAERSNDCRNTNRWSHLHGQVVAKHATIGGVNVRVFTTTNTHQRQVTFTCGERSISRMTADAILRGDDVNDILYPGRG